MDGLEREDYDEAWKGKEGERLLSCASSDFQNQDHVQSILISIGFGLLDPLGAFGFANKKNVYKARRQNCTFNSRVLLNPLTNWQPFHQFDFRFYQRQIYRSVAISPLRARIRFHFVISNETKLPLLVVT